MRIANGFSFKKAMVNVKLTLIVFLCYLSLCTLSSCQGDDAPAPTPQLGEYSRFEDCPIDVAGKLNGYALEASAFVRAKTDYPEDHFIMSIMNFRGFGAQSILLLISGRYDSLSLGTTAIAMRYDRKDTLIVAPLNAGEIAASVQLRLDGGIRFSITGIDYKLDETAGNNFFILDSIAFVNDNPRQRGGMWYGRFDLSFELEDTAENKEDVNYARSVGVQIPEKLHYQDVSFSAPTRVNILDIDCGR